MNKYEKETKEDIAKRLKISSKEGWITLSEEKQEQVIDKYYHYNDIERIGLGRVLENNRQMRKDYGFMILGISIGLIGNIFISSIFKYFPKNSLLFDGSIIILFICLIKFIIAEFDKLSCEDLGNNKVLIHLLNEIEQDEINKQKNAEKL